MAFSGDCEYFATADADYCVAIYRCGRRWAAPWLSWVDSVVLRVPSAVLRGLPT